MNVEMVAISALKPAEYNPRIMPRDEMANLKRSLDEFGFVEPVVARKEDGLVIGGHQRLEARRQLAADRGEVEPQVPVVWVSLSDARAKALNLALNRISGDWDYERLSQILADLGPVEEIQYTGFSDKEISDILAVTATSFDDVDEVAEDASPLAGLALHFEFDVATAEEAELVRAVLGRHGMTGPKNASAALVAALRAVP